MGEELLKEVKSALGVTGEFQDERIKGYIEEVVGFLKDAGVSGANITPGIVARGVDDMWNRGGELSEYFMRRAVQLVYKEEK